MLSVDVSQITLALIRFVGVILFIDFYLRHREKRLFILSLGWLLLTLSPIGRLFSESVFLNSEPSTVIHFVLVSVTGLLAVVGISIVVFTALSYFTTINSRTVARFGSTGIIFMVLIHLTFPAWITLITIGAQNFILIAGLIIIIVNKKRFSLITKSNGYWLVAALSISLIQTAIYLLGGYSGSAGETYAYPLTILVSLIWIIFFVRLEAAITEKALRESEIRYRSLVEQASDGIFIADKNGKYVDVNPKGCTMLGYTREEILGKTMKDLAAADELAKKPFRLDELRAGKTLLNERNLVRKDGSLVAVEISAKMLPDENLQGITRDITERKQNQEILAKSEKKYRELYQSMRDAYVTVDMDGRILEFNDTYLEMLGYSSEEIRALTFQDITPKKWHIFEQSIVDTQILPLGYSEVYEKEYIRKDGLIIPVELRAFLVRDEVGKPTSLWAIVRDITERKQAQIALQESEQRFRELYELAPLGYQSLDIEGFIIDVNQAWLDTLGYSREEVIGKWFGDFLSPDFRLNFKNRFPLFKERGSIHSEFEFFHKNGHTLFIGIDGRIGTDHRGKFKQTHCILKDITEQHHYEEEILTLNAKLEQRVEERTKELKTIQDQLVRQERLAVLGQLAGSVGHELRNPLAVIKNAVYFLNHVLPDTDEKIKTYLAIIEQETQTSEKIINDLLDFSRIKSIEREPFALADLVHQTLDRFPVPTSIKLTCLIPEELPPAFVDPKQMVQVLGNLITNAYQAMPEGGELLISAASQDEKLTLMVKDTGSGISAENLLKIFEPLFTTKTKGIGLGLAVSKKLVEANEGLIEVRSTEGIGTEFKISLPIVSEFLK